MSSARHHLDAHFPERVVTFEHEALEHGPIVVEQQVAEDDFMATADGTCRRLWPTALLFAHFLCDHPEVVRGKRVVELGAGTGFVGMVCAALGAQFVAITDLPEALPLIKTSATRNPELNSRIDVLPCTWGEEAHIQRLLNTGTEGGPYDLVVCCEVVYKQDPSILEALAETQKSLARDSAEILLVYEFRGQMLDDLPYFEAIDHFVDSSTTVSLSPYNHLLPSSSEAVSVDEDTRTLYRYYLAKNSCD